ncbi:hypothetical protein JCM10213_000536 [Rhodosporidiobolus nylandii]
MSGSCAPYTAAARASSDTGGAQLDAAALAERFRTRVRYINFKVENKHPHQTLLELEYLYTNPFAARRAEQRKQAEEERKRVRRALGTDERDAHADEERQNQRRAAMAVPPRYDYSREASLDAAVPQPSPDSPLSATHPGKRRAVEHSPLPEEQADLPRRVSSPAHDLLGMTGPSEDGATIAAQQVNGIYLPSMIPASRLPPLPRPQDPYISPAQLLAPNGPSSAYPFPPPPPLASASTASPLPASAILADGWDEPAPSLQLAEKSLSPLRRTTSELLSPGAPASNGEVGPFPVAPPLHPHAPSSAGGTQHSPSPFSAHSTSASSSTTLAPTSSFPSLTISAPATFSPLPTAASLPHDPSPTRGEFAVGSSRPPLTTSASALLSLSALIPPSAPPLADVPPRRARTLNAAPTFSALEPPPPLPFGNGADDASFTLPLSQQPPSQLSQASQPTDAAMRASQQSNPAPFPLLSQPSQSSSSIPSSQPPAHSSPFTSLFPSSSSGAASHPSPKSTRRALADPEFHSSQSTAPPNSSSSPDLCRKRPPTSNGSAGNGRRNGEKSGGRSQSKVLVADSDDEDAPRAAKRVRVDGGGADGTADAAALPPTQPDGAAEEVEEELLDDSQFSQLSAVSMGALDAAFGS